MRFILLFLISLVVSASEFPKIFSSAGDELYENMKKYHKIKDLPVYKNRPELLEAYCFDANTTMQRGFALDKMANDLEVEVNKAMIRSYAKELRVLDKQNMKILSELNDDVGKMYDDGDFKSLKKISDAGFILSDTMLAAIKEDTKNQPSAAVEEKTKSTVKPVFKAVPNIGPAVSMTSIPTVAKDEDKAVINTQEVETVPVAEFKKAPTKLQYYEESLIRLKEELYALRESEDQEQMLCLNDITAINYWMINVLKSENDPCVKADAIKQMKSYDKASSTSCGRTSMRYIEWHGRIKPYVGKRLFEAEAGCNQ